LVEIEELTKAPLSQSKVPARPLPGISEPTDSQSTSVVAPKPSSALSKPPLLQPSSSDSISTLEIETEKYNNDTVSRLEAAAMKEKVITASSENTVVDIPSSKIQFVTPSFGSDSETLGDNNKRNGSKKSPGSFSAETALEESTISPTER
jgi:hypothetical protein